jgi:hypothetical protein
VNVSKWTLVLTVAVAIAASLILTMSADAQTVTQIPGARAGIVDLPMGGAMAGAAMHRGTGRGMGIGAGMRMGSDASLIAVAAEKLGMTVDALVAELRAGKTIEELAQAKGVDVQTIVDAVLALRAERLKELVAAGTITQAQADAMLAEMKTHLETRVSEPFQPGSGTCPRRGSGPGRGQRP